MALVSTNEARLTVKMIDRSQTNFVHTVIITGADAATRLTNAQAYIGLWEAVGVFEVVGYDVAEIYAEDAITIPASLASVSSIKASVTVALDGLGNKKANLSIPAPDPVIFVGTSNTVDITNQDLLDLVAAYSPANYATISDGESIRATEPIVNGKRVTYYSARP